MKSETIQKAIDTIHNAMAEVERVCQGGGLDVRAHLSECKSWSAYLERRLVTLKKTIEEVV